MGVGVLVIGVKREVVLVKEQAEHGGGKNDAHENIDSHYLRFGPKSAPKKEVCYKKEKKKETVWCDFRVTTAING